MKAAESQEKKAFGTGPAATVRRWLKELDLAEKVEKDWRAQAARAWKIYRGDSRKRNSYNILWSNTETLAPALFNTPPSPDVRRRFKDEDPIGKVVSQVLERCLEFQTDTEEFMTSIKHDVLDCLILGRGVSRVKYLPSLVPAEPAAAPSESSDGDPVQPKGTETPEADEVLAWEQCEIEHVQWDEFKRGAGKTWREVQWVAFGHRMTRDEIDEKFGEECAQAIAYDACADETVERDDVLKTVFGTARVWEFWCKEDRMVRWIAPGYKEKPLKELADPLRLNEFYPIPRPIYAIADSSSLVPILLYEQYKEQAEELDRISTRINRIVDALKFRGIYDSTVTELSELMRGDDNKLIPTQNVSAWMDKAGGISNAIYFMPIEMAANVLKVLYEQRESTKQVIYELSGIADIRRGSSDPGETLGAQELKADFGNQRISNLKLEVERYVRDLMRLMSEVIAERFQPDTLTRMAQLQIPTEEQIETKKAELVSQAAQQAQQQGQQPNMQQIMQSLPPRPISLEQVVKVLHDDATRMFKIDVETDSMIAATLRQDMTGLRDVLTGVAQAMNAFAPAVERGAMPVEAVKEILMTVCRRSKMGSAVEDALDKIQAPQQKPDPEQAKAEAAAQAAQVKAQADERIAQSKAETAATVAQIKAESDARIAEVEARAQQQTDMVRQQAEAAQHQAKIDSDARFEQLKAMLDDERNMREQSFLRWKAELDAATKVEVANIGAKAKVDNEATQTATREIASEVTQ